MKFKDKVALVTGAAQGIGFEICSQLASQGAIVVLNDIDPVLAEEAANNINKEKHIHSAYDSKNLKSMFIIPIIYNL